MPIRSLPGENRVHEDADSRPLAPVQVMARPSPAPPGEGVVRLAPARATRLQSASRSSGSAASPIATSRAGIEDQLGMIAQYPFENQGGPRMLAEIRTRL